MTFRSSTRGTQSALKAALASVGLAALCSCSLVQAPEPTHQELSHAVVDYLAAQPGFTKVDALTIARQMPGGMNATHFRLMRLVNNGCERHNWSSFDCDISTLMRMNVTDGGGSVDSYSGAVTRLLSWMGANVNAERRTVRMVKGLSGWQIKDVSGRR